MKLQDIQPGKQSGKQAVMALQRAAQKHLILKMSGFKTDLDTWPVSIYIISDVPPINDAQWDRLYNLSFPTGSMSEYGGIFPVHLEFTDARDGKSNLNAWYQWFEDSFDKEKFRWRGDPDNELPPVKVLKWKEFVAKVRAEYPPQDDEEDDFDE